MLAAIPFLLIPLFSAVLAANDWDVACKGECSYDIPDAAVSGTLTISGGSNAVSDITPAGGWTILDCDARSLTQNIRLVCHSSACEHLFEGHGAIDTLIRLPETCGPNAFARVSDIHVDADQALPSDVKAAITRPGNITSMVFVLSVDTNFAAVNATKTGPVSFSLEGYNFPVALDASTTKRDARALKTRNWTAFNSTNSFDLPPLHIDETFPLFSASVDCTDFSASVSANFTTKVDATVSIGLIATGTVIPPVIDDLAVYAGVDSSILATLDLTSSATGTISTGKMSLYSTALAGVDFPGIFTLGPTFDIYGDLEATLDADFSVSVDLAYNLDAVRMFYPPDAEASSGSSSPATSSVVISAVPNLSINSKVQPILTPEIKLGLEAFSLIKASVSLDVEGSLTGTLNIDGSGNASVSTTGKGASGEIEACVDFGAALSVNVEAEGSLDLLGLSKSADYTLFSDSWDLYNKCASTSGSTKRDSARVSSGLGRRADLTCPTSSMVTSIEKIIDEVIADIKSSTSS
ncbi:hypothetical protein B0H19DRAFT_1159447 [Mycena capillaripes]|nr:hypothetical protein B0H19DRAFT_1159447 [Mycena capillaripes]